MILVTGATGSIGRPLVRLLQEAGAAVKALVRDEAKGRALGLRRRPRRLRRSRFDRHGSRRRPPPVPQRRRRPAGGRGTADDPPAEGRHRRGAEGRRGKDREVSVWHAREGGRLAEGAHWEIERYLKESGLRWSLLRPSSFMQNFLTGAGSFTADGNLIGSHGAAPVSYVDCEDIAACAATLLTGPYGNGETFVLTGPEALTQAQIAERLSAALEREIRHVDLPPEELATTLRSQGLPSSFADDVAALSKDVANGSLAATTSAVHDLTGRPARTFDAFLAAGHQASCDRRPTEPQARPRQG